MDPSHLEPDELKVECDLRNIRGLHSVQLSLLLMSLELEKSGENEPPLRAHESALKNPKREVAKCGAKLLEIQEVLKESLQSGCPMKMLVLDTMKTRVKHYMSRLSRISFSPAVESEYPVVVKLSEELLSVLDKVVVEDEDRLNESIRELDSLDKTKVNRVVVESTRVPESQNKVENLLSNPPIYTQVHDVQPGQQVHNSNIPVVTALKSSNTPAVVPISNMGMDRRISFENLQEQINNIVLAYGAQSEVSRQDPNLSIINPQRSLQNDPIPLESSPTIPNQLFNRLNRSDNVPVNSKPTMVHKWNLSFDGSQEGLNIERFLFRVETNASSYSLPQYQLLSDIQYLLKGKALNWYWTYKEVHHPMTWSELKCAMIRQFSNDRNDFDVRQSIGERKQKSVESFQDFYSSIIEMTLALSKPLSDFDLMLILHGNMRVGLKEKLAGLKFTSSAELFNYCVRIENTWQQISYVPENHIKPVFRNSSNPLPNYSKPNPPNRFVHELEPSNLASSTADILPIPDMKLQQSVVEDQMANVSALNTQNRSFSSNVHQLLFPKHLFDKVKCWNCGLMGHFYYRCPTPLQHIFCRGCGQPDILFEYCSKCQGNQRREARVGMQSSRDLTPNPTPELRTTEEVASNTDPELYRIMKRNTNPN